MSKETPNQAWNADVSEGDRQLAMRVAPQATQAQPAQGLPVDGAPAGDDDDDRKPKPQAQVPPPRAQQSFGDRALGWAKDAGNMFAMFLGFIINAIGKFVQGMGDSQFAQGIKNWLMSWLPGGTDTPQDGPVQQPAAGVTRDPAAEARLSDATKQLQQKLNTMFGSNLALSGDIDNPETVTAITKALHTLNPNIAITDKLTPDVLAAIKNVAADPNYGPVLKAQGVTDQMLADLQQHIERAPAQQVATTQQAPAQETPSPQAPAQQQASVQQPPASQTPPAAPAQATPATPAALTAEQTARINVDMDKVAQKLAPLQKLLIAGDPATASAVTGAMYNGVLRSQGIENPDALRAAGFASLTFPQDSVKGVAMLLKAEGGYDIGDPKNPDNQKLLAAINDFAAKKPDVVAGLGLDLKDPQTKADLTALLSSASSATQVASVPQPSAPAPIPPAADPQQAATKPAEAPPAAQSFFAKLFDHPITSIEGLITGGGQTVQQGQATPGDAGQLASTSGTSKPLPQHS